VVGARLPAAGPRRPSCGGPSLVRRRRTIKGLFNRRRLLQPPSSYWLRLAALEPVHRRPYGHAPPPCLCWPAGSDPAAGCCWLLRWRDGAAAAAAGWLLLLGTESDSDSAKVAPPLISCVFRSQPKVRRLAGRSYGSGKSPESSDRSGKLPALGCVTARDPRCTLGRHFQQGFLPLLTADPAESASPAYSEDPCRDTARVRIGLSGL
jgi:hypothetical protein